MSVGTENKVFCGSTQGTVAVEVKQGFTQGSINNYGTALLLITFSDGSVAKIQPKGVYNFDFNGRTYPALSFAVASGGNADYIFWY